VLCLRASVIVLIQAAILHTASAYDQPPVVPVIDDAMKARLREVHAVGAALGNYPDVVSRMGDSITASNAFLTPIGCGNVSLAGHADLLPVIAYYGARSDSSWRSSGTCGLTNSFTRVSACAVSGWSAIHALTEPGYCPDRSLPAAACELLWARPAIALIMFGTNDMEHYSASTFRASMTAIAQQCVTAGVIPVLSTIPHRFDSAARAALVIPYNQIVTDVAGEQRVPVWNYWLALQKPGMVNGGIGGDGIHPNVAGGGGDFGAQGLRYGYNVRNFTALQVLEKVTRVVILDGTPDPSPTPPLQSVVLAVSSTSAVVGGPLSITVAVQPIGQVFDAWAAVAGSEGQIYSFIPGRPNALAPGARPLARRVQGLSNPYAATLLSLSALPPGASGSWTVIVRLVPPGTSPAWSESAIPGYAAEERIAVVE
jgi:hypothetical protein